MQTGYKVIDVMTRRPITAGPSDTVRQIAQLMRDKNVGSILLREGDELQGIITEWDIVRKSCAGALDSDRTPASAVMTRADEMVTIAPGVDIFDALNKMRDRDVRHLPVVDAGKLVGYITLKDILKLQPQLFELIVDKYDIRERERKEELLG